MCGICGFTGFNDRHLIRKMCDIIRYRGPDDEGYFSDKNVELGMRRLSIIDLEGGHQPLYYTMVNGSIIFGSEIKSILLHDDIKRVVDKAALKFGLILC